MRAGGEGAAFNLSIRGLQGRRVATYLGPVRLDDPATGILDLSEVPSGALQDAVLTRGATGSSEGALGGALVLRPTTAVIPVMRAALTTGAEKLWAADVAAGGPMTWGRFTGGTTAMARGSVTDGRFSYVPVIGPREAPVDLPARDRVNNDRRRVGFTLLTAGEWLGGPSVEGVLDVADMEGGIPGFGVQPLAKAREHQTRGVAGVTVTLPMWHRVRSRVELSGRTAVWRFEDSRPGARVKGALFSTSGTVATLLETSIFPTAVAGVGTRTTLDVARANGDAGGFTGWRPQGSAFGTFKVSVWRNRWTTEMRPQLTAWYVRVSTEKGEVPVRGVFMPELRTSLRLWDRVTVHAAFARAWRNPSLEELYRPQNAPLGGNPNLLPEDGLELNTGVMADLGILKAGLSAYAARMFNVIAFVNVNAFDVKPLNIGDAYRAGGELVLSAELGDWGEVKSGVDLNWSRVVASGAAIPNVPLLDWRGQLFLGPPRARGLLEVTSRSGTAGNFYGELAVRPATRVNAGVQVNALPSVTVQAMVRNVLDERNQTDTWGLPLPGREAFVTITAEPSRVLGGVL